MAPQDRKDRDQRSTTTENKDEQSLQARRSRNEMASRDPFGAFWRDPFGSFWTDPFNVFERELRPWAGTSRRGSTLWAPQIETFQRGDQFVVRADLPGMKKENVNVELTDDTLTIEGERRDEREEDREGFYRSERSYGSFCRVVQLPEGTIAESAKATFRDGVLEVSLQAPPREVSRTRRLEIAGADEGDRNEKDRARTEGQR